MQEFILKPVIEFGLKRLGDSLSKTHTSLRVSTEDLQTSLDHHLRHIKNWCTEISFADLRSARKTDQAFEPLDVLLHPRRYRISAAERADVLPLETAILQTVGQSSETSGLSNEEGTEIARHLIILGQPGAGKTTSMKYLCQRLLTDDSFLFGYAT